MDAAEGVYNSLGVDKGGGVGVHPLGKKDGAEAVHADANGPVKMEGSLSNLLGARSTQLI